MYYYCTTYLDIGFVQVNFLLHVDSFIKTIIIKTC